MRHMEPDIYLRRETDFFDNSDRAHLLWKTGEADLF